MQDAPEQPGEVGITAPDGREGLHFGCSGQYYSVFRGKVGVTLWRRHARPLGTELDEPANTQQIISSLDKVEAHGALSLMLVRADEGGVRFQGCLQNRGSRVDNRGQTFFPSLTHQSHEEIFVQIRR